jgi:hypothetical protein
MRLTSFLLLLLATPAPSADIIFTNKVVTITNLQGQRFEEATLVRGDLDGLIWRSQASGGRICYTNLDSDLLASFGISSNRIDIARARAERKAVSDAQYRALAIRDAALQNQQEREQWAKGAPEREAKAAANAAAAQQQADLATLRAMQARYDALEREDRYTRAMVMNGWQNGQDGYINHIAEEKLEDFRRNLEKAKRQYQQRYGSIPE